MLFNRPARYIRILGLLLLTAVTARAQEPPALQTFSDYGYGDQSIYGLHGAGTMYFHVEPDVNFDTAYLRVRMLYSQVLDRPNSFVNFMISDVPYRTIRLPAKDDTIDVVFRFTERQVVSGYLKLKITTNIRITDNRCNDLTTDALWVKVLSGSVIYTPKNPQYKGRQRVFISKALVKKQFIIYSDTIERQDFYCVSALHSFFTRLTGKSPALATFSSMPDSIRNYVVAARMDHMPEDMKMRMNEVSLKPGQGLIFLDREQVDTGDGSGQKITIERLFVTGIDKTGFERAISAFITKDVVLSAFTRYEVVNAAVQPIHYFTPQPSPRLTLADLGAMPEVLEGIGSLSNTYIFRKSDFGVAISQLELGLHASYTPIGSQDRGFFNLYLNSHFLKSIRLDDKGKIDFKAEIDYHKLQKDNTLRVEFIFYPSGGDCKYSFLKFNCQIDVQESYLKVLEDFSTKRPNFFWFPEIFYDKPISILVSKSMLHDLIAPLSEIYTNLNYQVLNKFDIYPEVFITNELSDSSIQNILRNQHVMALLSSRDPLITRLYYMPVSYTWRFKNFRNSQVIPLFQLLYSDKVSIAQIFTEKSDNLVMTLIAEGDSMSSTLTALVRSFQKQSMPVKGNVIIGNEDDNYFFDVYEKNLDGSEVKTKNPFLEFWNEYSNYLLVLMLVLTILFFLFLRQRTQRSKSQF